MRTLLAVGCWLLMDGLGCLASAAAGPWLLQQQGPVSLATAAAVDNGVIQLQLSGQLLLTVCLDSSEPVALETPVQMAPHAAWRTRAAVKPILEDTGPGPGRWRQTLVLEPLLPGRHSLQLEPLRWRQGTGPWQTVTWGPIEINVGTLGARPDLRELRDITAIEELPAAAKAGWGSWPSVALALMGGSGLLAWACWSGRRRQRRRQPLATNWSLHRLERLLARDLPGAGHGRRFHALLSRLVRSHLERQYRLPARRRPVAETMQAAAAVLPPPRQAALVAILDRCSRAQFAPQPPGPDECRQAAELVRAFLAPVAPPV